MIYFIVSFDEKLNCVIEFNNTFKPELVTCFMDYNLLVGRIVKEAGLEKSEVERKIEAKKAKLSGLISKEGAAQIVAAELGVDFDNVQVKISEIGAGMKNANLIGKIIRLFPVREFERNGRKGKVCSFIIADDTGSIRIVLWDTNHIELIETEKIKEGDVIEIKNGNVRGQEVHLSNFAEIKKSEEVLEEVKTERAIEDKLVNELVEGVGVRVRGCVVQLFPARFFYVCPECGKKAEQEGDGFRCGEHGRIQAKERAILNFILDDGSGTIRVVLFSDGIENLIKEEELKEPEKWSAFRDDLLGSELWVAGNVRKNQLFGNLEIIGQDVEKVDVEKLIEILERG